MKSQFFPTMYIILGCQNQMMVKQINFDSGMLFYITCFYNFYKIICFTLTYMYNNTYLHTHITSIYACMHIHKCMCMYLVLNSTYHLTTRSSAHVYMFLMYLMSVPCDLLRGVPAWIASWTQLPWITKCNVHSHTPIQWVHGLFSYHIPFHSFVYIPLSLHPLPLECKCLCHMYDYYLTLMRLGNNNHSHKHYTWDTTNLLEQCYMYFSVHRNNNYEDHKIFTNITLQWMF